MHRAFVIDGEQVEMEVGTFSSTQGLLDVTPVGGAWIKRVSTGQTTAYLTGFLPDGTAIDGSFVVVGHLEDGTLVLVSEPYLPTVG